jgi:uncharacterized membrane protein YkoI
MFENEFDKLTSNYNYYNRISIVDSIEIAKNHIDGEVTKARLYSENGVLVYKIRILTLNSIEYNIEVDAISGNITKTESINKAMI